MNTTTAPDTAEIAQRRAWARNVFDLPADASPQAVRAVVMAHLDQAELVPSANWRQAIRVLCESEENPSLPQSGFDAFDVARENALAEEIDQFAAQFFSLPKVQRRGKWAELSLRADAYARLRLRLAGFQRGLNVVAVAPADESREAILSKRLCRLFVLKPAARESQRRAWLLEMEGDWRRDVRRFRAAHVDVASLDPDLLDALVALENGPAAARQAVVTAQNRLRESAAAKAKAAVAVRKSNQAASTRSSGGGLPWGAAGIVAIMLFNALRMCNNSSSYRHDYNYTPPSYNSPSYTPPNYNSPGYGNFSQPPANLNTPEWNTALERALLQVERDKAARTKTPVAPVPSRQASPGLTVPVGPPSVADPSGKTLQDFFDRMNRGGLAPPLTPGNPSTAPPPGGNNPAALPEVRRDERTRPARGYQPVARRSFRLAWRQPGD